MRYWKTSAIILLGVLLLCAQKEEGKRTLQIQIFKVGLYGDTSILQKIERATPILRGSIDKLLPMLRETGVKISVDFGPGVFLKDNSTAELTLSSLDTESRFKVKASWMEKARFTIQRKKESKPVEKELAGISVELAYSESPRNSKGGGITPSATSRAINTTIIVPDGGMAVVGSELKKVAIGGKKSKEKEGALLELILIHAKSFKPEKIKTLAKSRS